MLHTFVTDVLPLVFADMLSVQNTFISVTLDKKENYVKQNQDKDRINFTKYK